MSARPGRVDVLGVQISTVDVPGAVDEIARIITDGERSYVCVTGVHGVMESQADGALRAIHNRSGLTTPDGMPMVWAAHRAGAAHTTRVCGRDLMLAVCARAVQEGWTSYFYGAAPGVADELAAQLVEQFPGLRLAGTMSPPYGNVSAEEDERIVRELNTARPDLVWVGLSTPKQERWMDTHRAVLDAPVLLGVGGAFDMHAGRIPAAPGWMQRSGLEWSYRLWKEPRRLWRRYLRNNPRFALAILRRPPHLVPDDQHTA